MRRSIRLPAVQSVPLAVRSLRLRRPSSLPTRPSSLPAWRWIGVAVASRSVGGGGACLQTDRVLHGPRYGSRSRNSSPPRWNWLPSSGKLIRWPATWHPPKRGNFSRRSSNALDCEKSQWYCRGLKWNQSRSKLGWRKGSRRRQGMRKPSLPVWPLHRFLRSPCRFDRPGSGGSRKRSFPPILAWTSKPGWESLSCFSVLRAGREARNLRRQFTSGSLATQGIAKAPLGAAIDESVVPKTSPDAPICEHDAQVHVRSDSMRPDEERFAPGKVRSVAGPPAMATPRAQALEQAGDSDVPINRIDAGPLRPAIAPRDAQPSSLPTPRNEFLAATHPPSSSEPFCRPSQPREREIETNFGGVFYLLNAALQLGLYGDFTTPMQPGLALPVWDFLALAGRELAGSAIRRRSALAVAGRVGRTRATTKRPGRSSTRQTAGKCHRTG